MGWCFSRPLYRESFEHDAGGILAYGIPNMKLPKELVRRRIDLMTDGGATYTW